ncbi:DprA-like DNA recombination-mediator protein [Vibrio phage phi 3]|uniref:Uncharacterized protein n=1 Tax=Vibrio phage phi 3 TaxID=1589298 RepID=A0A0B5HAT5_9CAUD|nr:DprA-like DNA recombination-mediator protein [Vibrio phage phi 3]AJF40874.1 hypothetical protein SBVP3_00107 [Vibrio phage phi 3]
MRRIATIGKLLDRLGYTGRSGNAVGSDIEWDKHLQMLHILPHNGHRSSEGLPKRYHDNVNYVALEVCPLHIREQALRIIRPIIRNFDDRPESHRNLHLRNVFQPLGLDLKDHARLTVYTAPETRYGTVAGGTRSAVMISRNYGIPTYNLRIDSQFYQLKEILENELKTQIDNDNKSYYNTDSTLGNFCST